MPANVGQVTRQRYDENVAGDRQLVARIGRAMFTIGGHAAEIEPMRPQGGSSPRSDDEFFGVRRRSRYTRTTSAYR
ncbi:hypothetical protein EDD90_10793 [Streptomyces sp. Ag109_O5-1]|uniref:hypothetical protein n=1 Tax=Streptomyces sp. Ag109_O5-1 TaxID=1938851 RepID=UPI000F501421|nr:hypothetical protein [Streptomyces sp. Ag109_O5-1]RPE27110.1 hypothetical protein EDD90_10793 [Streptomyces sp. Ag109_O5-1]